VPREDTIEHDIRARSDVRPPDRAIADLARRQHGVVSRKQLLGLGLGRGAIGHRVAVGRLHPVHAGAYAVGHPLTSRHGRWMAAVLVAGEGAVLSHRCAAALWGIGPGSPGLAEVTSPRRGSRRGMTLHWSRLAADEVTRVDGIPVTSVARTLLELAGVLRPRALERALDEAERLRLGGPLSLVDVVARHPGRRGVAVARALLAAGRVGVDVTRSELEERFLCFLDRAGLPRPRLNVVLGVGGRAFEVDCAWPARRLVVELDGHATHSTRAAYERDRARDRVLQAAGWRVVRVTWRQLHGDPDRVAADLAALLARYAQAG
jgi:hypothetical protein